MAETLLKQFGGSNVKQEIEDDRNAVADSTTNLNFQRPIKCEATSTSRKSPNNLKNEPVIKIESIYETNRKVNFDITMNAKQIQEAVRWVQHISSNFIILFSNELHSSMMSI